MDFLIANARRGGLPKSAQWYLVALSFICVKGRIQIQVYNSNKESVSHFSQFISVKDEKNLRKSQAQFWEKLRKLRLRENDRFLIKNLCNCYLTVQVQKKSSFPPAATFYV